MTIAWTHNIPFVSIFLAMFAGIVTPFFRNPKVSEKICLSVTAIIAVFSAILLYDLGTTGESFTFMMGHYPAPWGNELRAGPLEALLALMFSLIMLLAVVGGRRDIGLDILPDKQKLYFVMLNLMLSSLLALVYTNDLFTGYVFIEINTIAACALVMAKDTSRGLVATMRYLILMQVGSGLFLIGIVVLYGVTGHLLMPNIQMVLGEMVTAGKFILPITVVVALIMLGLSLKSAVFPFHTMLPGAHSVSTPASSAILSGLVLKGYVVLLIKLLVRVFTIDILEILRIDDLMFVMGALSMIVCSVYALKETDLKRMVAYSSSAQIGYLYLGMGMGNMEGMAAACLQILVHAAAKSMIFLSAGGLTDAADHKTSLHDLHGTARKNMWAGIGFTVGALCLIGLPLLGGFAVKLYLAKAAFGSTFRTVVTLVALCTSMLLNALYFVPAVISIWSKPKEEAKSEETALQEGKKEAPYGKSFAISIACLLVVNFFLGVCYEPVMNLIRKGLEVLL